MKYLFAIVFGILSFASDLRGEVIYATNRLPDSPKVESVKASYPIRSNWWTGCPDWRHLATGVHAGKFDVAWLKGLSNEELQSLHADDHEGKVKWEYAVRGQVKAVNSQSNCPGGVCPSSSFPRRKLFIFR